MAVELKHRYVALAAVFVAATLSSPASAEDAPDARLTMTVISDDAYGRMVTKGNYEQAIGRITRNGRRAPDKFADQTNLCVAYTKRYEIEKARTACDAAVSAMEKAGLRTGGNPWHNDASMDARQSNLAVALSNRGVLLTATGEAARARRDFLAAIQLESAVTSIAENNLERLGQLTTS